jgi:hypothetical protein
MMLVSAILLVLQGGAVERAAEKAWKQQGGRIAAPECVLVSTAEEWAALWTRDGGRPEERPEVDFSVSVVVAVFRGQVLQSERAVFTVAREFEDRVAVRYSTGWAMCGNEPRSADALFVRLPRIRGKKRVVEHERTRFLTVDPRIERLEFPALK